jgi:hypothetical protein
MDPMLVRALIVGASVFVAIAAVMVVRRWVPYEVLRQNHEFTGVAYAIVGAVYGVYLAFTIVVVWQQFDQAEQNATTEAVHLSEVWRDVQVLPTEARHGIELRLRDYAEAVVEREWPAMSSGHSADAEAASRYEAMWQALYDVRDKADGPGDRAFFNEAVVQMNTIGGQRRLRLLQSDSALPSIMWILLIGGGIITVGFTLLMGTPDLWMQASVTAALTALIAFSLLLVLALQHPFSGDISVKPTAYISVLQSFRDRLQRR